MERVRATDVVDRCCWEIGFDQLDSPTINDLVVH
jgi:hypothetical protein